MEVIETALPGVATIRPALYEDARGFFYESFNERQFAAVVAPGVRFVQDNQSRSRRGVLRGLHFQNPDPQGKLVRCVRGAIYDVAVDIRRSSPHFGEWVGAELGEDDPAMVWIPAGFAHGFLVLSDVADVLYKATDYYSPGADRSVRWDDPAIGIEWPLQGPPLLSAKDAAAPLLAAADVYD